jgi:hypothetical protein
MIKSRRIRWVGMQNACEEKYVQGFGGIFTWSMVTMYWKGDGREWQ